MASETTYREIYGFVEHRENNKVLTASAEESIYKDTVLNLDDVEYDFEMLDGDRIKISVRCTNPPQVFRIEPSEPLQQHVGKITYLTRDFGVVDEEYLFFVNDQMDGWQPKPGDQVQCMLIDGDYKVGRNTYQTRCATIEKYHEQDTHCDFLNGTTNNDENLNDDIVDSEVGDLSDPKFQFEHCAELEPKEQYYDLPFGLYDVLHSKNPERIKRKLDSFVPKYLTYDTYKTRFHALIHLEETEMKTSFDRYKSKEIWIRKEGKRHSSLCSKIKQLRPPISVGDRVEVRKHKNLTRYYRGLVERVYEDRFVLKFRRDFIDDFREDEAYQAEFIYSRTVFKRKHAAIDYAKMKMPQSFLFPDKLFVAETLQLNVALEDEKLTLNGEEIPWFKDCLNIEQKETVTASLRGECRPQPFIIFGPPGTGKTSTLIEIILQVSVHIADAKILVATQSNTAANVIASYLIKENPEIAKTMIRLVSNSALDRKNLPEDLHRYSASIRNSNIDQNDMLEVCDHTHKNVNKDRDLEYLKDFKIIVGTCVGMGIMFGSDFSNGYFSHVFIDEAAQCNECETMIPVAFVNLDRGQVIMSGDPLQLPPITLSNHAKHLSLDKSMLERFLEMYEKMDGVVPTEATGYDARLVAKLRRNYRSLPSILNFYNQQFYDSQLIPTVCGESSPEAILLHELSIILPKNDKTSNPFGIWFVDVKGMNVRLENKKSWANYNEINAMMALIPKLLKRNISKDDIGIISPYYAQVTSIKNELLSRQLKGIRVGTVEEYQGEEKSVILISAVKTSGLKKALQFIFCPKRLNTAISRARMLVMVFGCAPLLENDKNWAALIEYCKEHGSYMEATDIKK